MINTVCMDCGKECKRWEIVNVKIHGEHYEVWCYCKECDIETFHPYDDPRNDPNYED